MVRGPVFLQASIVFKAVVGRVAPADVRFVRCWASFCRRRACSSHAVGRGRRPISGPLDPSSRTHAPRLGEHGGKAVRPPHTWRGGRTQKAVEPLRCNFS
jgi:hypothetical protein